MALIAIRNMCLALVEHRRIQTAQNVVKQHARMGAIGIFCLLSCTHCFVLPPAYILDARTPKVLLRRKDYALEAEELCRLQVFF